MATVAHTMAPGIYKKLAYNFERDFEPITIVATVPNILIVNPALPAKTVAELIAYLKANPCKVSYGSAGFGSTDHMSAELFRVMSGTDIVHVPYRGGSPMLADLVAGNIQMSIETSGAATRSSRAAACARSRSAPAKRSALFPDLPTLAESGLKGYDVSTWYGFLVPKGTPEPIRQKLYAAVAGILKDPEIVKKLNGFGAELAGPPRPSSPPSSKPRPKSGSGSPSSPASPPRVGSWSTAAAPRRRLSCRRCRPPRGRVRARCGGGLRR